MAPSVHLAIGVSPLLSQLVPRLRLRQQLRHRALAQTQNVPGDDRRFLYCICSFCYDYYSSFSMNISFNTENIDPTLRRASVRYCEQRGVLELSESLQVCQELGLLFVPCCNAACPEICLFLFVEVL